MAQMIECSNSSNKGVAITGNYQSVYDSSSEMFQMDLFSDSNSTRRKHHASPFSTSTSDIFMLAEQRFKEKTPAISAFVNLLHHTAFEDGMSNEAIEIVKKLVGYDPFLTVAWLYSVYGSCQRDSVVIDALLRIIAFLEFPQSLSLCFIPMTRLAMLDASIHCQESAIMLCEVWRTKECLTLLQDAPIDDPLLKSYAESIIAELSQELIDAHAS